MNESPHADPVTQPPRVILEQVSDPLWRRADFFCVSLEMVGHLPGLARRNTDTRIWVACFESFLVHVRLVAEFLARPSKDKDFTARGFLWPLPESEAARRLRDKHWVTASKYVVHFSAERVPDDLADLEPIDPLQYMKEAADDVFALAAEFVDAVERSGHELADMFRQALDLSRTVLSETYDVEQEPAPTSAS